MTSLAVVPHSVWQFLSFWAYLVGEAVSVAFVFVVLFSRRAPQAKTAWILALLGFPWFGPLFYLGFGRRRLEHRVLRLRDAAAAQVSAAAGGPGDAPARRAAHGLVRAPVGCGIPRAVEGNEFTLLAEGPEAFAAAQEAVAGARRHVHLVTYIFKRDTTGRGTLAVLESAARRGVEVRVLYDGLGSLTAISRGAGFFDPLRRAGARVEAFLPVSRLRAGLRVNLRNHRKLLVVDGHTAFTGGMNVGDEYRTGANWRDAHCRLRGPVAATLQRTFAQDWYTATGTALEDPSYYAAAPPAGDVPVQVVESGPDQEDPLAEDLIFGAFASARRSIDVVTPYFVPTEPVEQALRSAVLRGRRVRILIGATVDHRVARLAGEVYLLRMMDAGVEVWMRPEMVHGKVVVVDRAWATLGSTNIDARSLRLNFELNVAMPHAPTAERLAGWFEAELAGARRLAPSDFSVRWPRRLLRAGAHLFSPLL